MNYRCQWTFLVGGEKWSIVSTESKTKALLELGDALGLQGYSKGYKLRLVRRRNPKIIKCVPLGTSNFSGK